MTNWLRWFAAVACMLIATAASAAFQIDEIYSNADGSVQYVVLRETAGANGQQAFNGRQLVMAHGNVVKTFTFAGDLPSSATANRHVLIASAGFVALGLVAPDYVFSDRFLATDGGTLNFAGVDQVTYAALPTDGVNAINRAGATQPNVATNFAGATATVPPLPVTVVEYYDAVRAHFFISSLAPDIDALDSGRIPGWQRTGLTFLAYPSQESGGPGAQPVCRFYIPPQSGDSHFLSASLAECAAVLQKQMFDPAYAGYVYETPSAFFISLPDTASGVCPPATIPVYRLWNQRVDSNHRYTIDPAIKAQMLALGFVAEGYGPDAVAMCAPTTQPIDLSHVNINGIVWTGTLFVAVAAGPSGNGLIFTSTDGLNWSVRSSGTPSLRGIVWTGSEIVAVGSGGTIVTSPDGYRWSAQTSGTTGALNGVAWSGTEFRVVGDGGAMLVSPDGVAWSPRVSKTTVNLHGIAWTGARFFLVGDNGTILTVLLTGVPTPRASGTTNNLAAIDVTPNGRLIAVGAQGTILVSNDGITWSTTNSGSNSSFQGITAAGTQIVVVGTGGRILTSTNGTVWAAQQSKTAINLAGVAWSGTLYVAVGATGIIDTSPDGITWTMAP
ncbi:MAG: hypothetical protein M3R31_04840 [Pseudomonadota bacterium]|nr:hypothetical protein [Pseudomonadota bacterium]